MSYDCCFRDYNPYKTLVRTHTKEDEYVREMEYSQDVNGPMPYLIIHHNQGGGLLQKILLLLKLHSTHH